MAQKAYGATLEYSDTLTGTYVAIARIKTIKPPKVTAKDIDTTVLDSEDEYEEKIPGLASTGDLECDIEYEKTKTADLYELFRLPKAFQIHYADDSGWRGMGYLSEIGDQDVENGKVVMTSVKISITGKWEPLADVTGS
jgi:hypothetical protein